MHAPTRAPSGRSRAHASIACISAANRLGPSSVIGRLHHATVGLRKGSSRSTPACQQE